MGTTFTKPIFCGDMGGKLTTFSNSGATTFVDITTANPNGPIRIDTLGVSLDDLVAATIALRITDGTNIQPLANIPLTLPFRAKTTNQLVTFAWAVNSITRSAGSWFVDGFRLGDCPVINNAVDLVNNITGLVSIQALTDTVMTFSASPFLARGAYLGICSIMAPDVATLAYKNPVVNTGITLAFAATTITRSAGSWITDGYAIGQCPVVTGSPDVNTNNIMFDGRFPITAVTDTVLTMASATMTARAAYSDGSTTVKVRNPVADVFNPGVTNLLSQAPMAPFVGIDGAGNEFLEIPMGWKLQAAFTSALSVNRYANVFAKWGSYANS